VASGVSTKFRQKLRDAPCSKESEKLFCQHFSAEIARSQQYRKDVYMIILLQQDLLLLVTDKFPAKIP
jgi:hypothetical protein